jgi:sporulation protein YlmC with PRC-barrel domain
MNHAKNSFERRNDMHTKVLLSATTIIGDDVKNSAGEDLGRLEDVMLDVNDGRISYGVLTFGGFLGMGNKLFAIPWSALVLNTEEKCFYLNIDKEQLENAPGFDKDHWPNMADHEWGRTVYDYYGVDPYWD